MGLTVLPCVVLYDEERKYKRLDFCKPWKKRYQEKVVIQETKMNYHLGVAMMTKPFCFFFNNWLKLFYKVITVMAIKYTKLTARLFRKLSAVSEFSKWFVKVGIHVPVSVGKKLIMVVIRKPFRFELFESLKRGRVRE